MGMDKNIPRECIIMLGDKEVGRFDPLDGIPDLTPKEPVYRNLVIKFIYAGTLVYRENDWDDYEVYDGFLVIKKGEAWVAMYNLKEIFSVVLEK